MATRKDPIVGLGARLALPLIGKSNYVVEELSAERQHAIISWEHYFTT